MEIQIAQDIRKYKTKDIGNFSLKEAGFLAVGIGLGFLVYKLTGSYEYAIPPTGVVLAFGFLKPYGMTLPQFFKTVAKEMFFSPKIYINESDFEYDPDDIEFEEIQRENINDGITGLNKLAEKYGSDEEPLPLIESSEKVPISAEWSVIQTNTPVKYTKEETARILT